MNYAQKLRLILQAHGDEFSNVSFPVTQDCIRAANNESSEVFDIIQPGRRVKLKGYRQ